MISDAGHNAPNVMLKHNLLTEEPLRRLLSSGFGNVLCRLNVNQHP